MFKYSRTLYHLYIHLFPSHSLWSCILIFWKSQTYTEYVKKSIRNMKYTVFWLDYLEVRVISTIFQLQCILPRHDKQLVFSKLRSSVDLKTIYCLFFQYFSCIVAINFIDGGNWITQRKPLTCRKSQTNFIT